MDYSFVRHKGFSWSPELQSALNAVDQGSVLRGVPLVFAANGSHAVLPQSGVLGANTGGVNLGSADAMVTTQTCDIRGPGAVKTALLNVAPVYKVKELNPNLMLTDVANSKYLAHVSGTAFADDTYLVDLRFETAVEKSVIVGLQVDDGFATPEERSAFSKKLGEYRRRGAFDPTIEHSLLEPLEALFVESIASGDVYEIRVFGDPSITRAETVRLIVSCEPEADVEAIRAVISAWYDGIRESCGDLNLLPLIVKSVDELTVGETRGSVPVYFRKLSDDAPEA